MRARILNSPEPLNSGPLITRKLIHHWAAPLGEVFFHYIESMLDLFEALLGQQCQLWRDPIRLDPVRVELHR